LVISPRAPLGQALLGRDEGDEVEVKVEGKVHRQEIVAVY
jgi:transcription elongation GreA/GreB family factor